MTKLLTKITCNRNGLAILLTLILFDEIVLTAFSLSLNTVDGIDTDHLPFEFDALNIGEVHTRPRNSFATTATTTSAAATNAFVDSFNGVNGDFLSTRHSSFNQFAGVDAEFPLSEHKFTEFQEPRPNYWPGSFKKIKNPFTSSSLSPWLPYTPPLPPHPKKIYRPVVTPSPIGFGDVFKDKVKAVYPGTLWCGDGNTARSDREVGLFRNTDICCKMHDKCPTSIAAGQDFRGLRNNGFFTRSHCYCDQQFYNCLKKTNSLVSNKIGYTYFNILRPKCFRREYPVVGCKKWWDKKCRTYVVDDHRTPIWQWIENPYY